MGLKLEEIKSLIKAAIPDAEITIEEGDSVIVVALSSAIEKIEKIFGRKRHFFRFQ